MCYVAYLGEVRQNIVPVFTWPVKVVVIHSIVLQSSTLKISINICLVEKSANILTQLT